LSFIEERMPQVHLADETLMAYADGELDDSVVAAVEAAMRNDPGVPSRITAFIRSRQLARLVLGGPAPSADAESVSRVTAMILERTADETPFPLGRLRRGSTRPVRLIPLAACLVLAAGVAGYVSKSWLAPGSEEAGALMAGLESEPVGRVLSATPSGNAAVTPSGRLQPVSTFRSANGELCREFRLDRGREAVDAIACRVGQRWNLTFAVVVPSNDGAYAPAAGDEVADLYVRKSGLGDPLAADEEAAALKQ